MCRFKLFPSFSLIIKLWIDLIRPIGAFLFSHIADRHGRKDAMVYALVLMGVATLLIGLTPSYDSIGVIAPVLLIVFRLLQGISFGAEFGTASTWVVGQAARSKYRAFWGAWVGFAIPIGLLLGFGSVIFVKSLMTAESFINWGWRIFFIIGFLVAIAPSCPLMTHKRLCAATPDRRQAPRQL